jgi:UDP-glucose 4-epimerase
VAVTGGGGFIGAHVIRHLLDAGAEVDVLGPTTLRRQSVCSLIRNGQVSYLPFALMTDSEGLAGLLRDHDSLVHLRYRPPSTQRFWSSLGEGVSDNLLETVQLLDAAEMAGVSHVCLASSARVYQPPALGVDENGPVGGIPTPYTMIKLQQEDCLREWARQTGRQFTILRLATVYGPGETVDRAIPNFIRAVLSGRRPVVDGRGASLFDPIYVADVADAILCTLEKRADGTFNIGTGRGWPPRHVARLIIRICGAHGDVAENRSQPDRGGPVCNVGRALAVLGFKAATSLESGLRAEIDWWRRWQLQTA